MDPALARSPHQHIPLLRTSSHQSILLSLRASLKSIIRSKGVICVQADHIERGYVPRIAGERLPATYINHYTANGTFLAHARAIVSDSNIPVTLRLSISVLLNQDEPNCTQHMHDHMST